MANADGLSHGILQHSFALRIPPALHPIYTEKSIDGPYPLLSMLFEQGWGPDGFALAAVCEVEQTGAGVSPPGDYSLLVTNDLAETRARRLPFVDQRPTGGEPATEFTYPLPEPFSWAQGTAGPVDPREPKLAWDGFIGERPLEPPSRGTNDFLLAAEPLDPAATGDPWAVSSVLGQLLAHRRSRLFGPSLARRIFNVLLPYALLQPTAGSAVSSGAWLLQPALSLFRLPDEQEFRPVFSLTLFLVPVEVGGGAETPQVSARGITLEEMRVVPRGWSFATAMPQAVVPTYEVSGPLCGYLAARAPEAVAGIGLSTSSAHQSLRQRGPEPAPAASLSLRQTTELVGFAVASRMVSGPERTLDMAVRKKIGDRVLTSMSASRVTSLVVVDPRKPSTFVGSGLYPTALAAAMQAVSGATDPLPDDQDYRIDKPYYDTGTYAIGVLPGERCVVVTTYASEQQSYLESGLLQAGWVAYMVIGASTAIGTMRALYHDIEQVDCAGPIELAEIEREVVVDLHEIYDLDITGENYKHRYALLREHLGINRDYEALTKKLQSLYQQAASAADRRTQRWLIWLTAAIVGLSVLILAWTIVVAGK